MGAYVLKEKSYRLLEGAIISKSRQNVLDSPPFVHFLTKIRPAAASPRRDGIDLRNSASGRIVGSLSRRELDLITEPLQKFL
jgi:hypothetical protein